MMGNKIMPGDIAEIKTQIGYSYCMFTHAFDKHNDIVAVFDTVYESPLKDIEFDNVIANPLLFPQVIVAFRKIVKVGIWKKVAHREVPDRLKKFPLFKWFNPLNSSDWWLKDDKNEWRIGKLNEEQIKLPLYRYVNAVEVENYITGNSQYGILRPLV